MIDNFNYLFQYFEKENITIDKKEFEFQIQSHPDYPSLLSIVDTLTFFNIDNGAMRLTFSEIELLPDRFITFLKEEKNKPQLCLIEKKGNEYFQTKDKKTSIISKKEIETRWEGIVLIAEKTEIEITKSIDKSSWVLTISFLVTFILVLLQFKDKMQIKLFFLFPILGMLFSISALKNLFGTKSDFLNSFCNMTASTSCVTVVDSKKWEIFKIFNFSDLSVVFFASQFLGLLVFLFSGDVIAYITIQKIVLIASIPVLFLSVYYQKIVEKKWCPICLVIITIVLLELGYLIVFLNSAFSFSTKGLIGFGFVSLSVVIIWSALKNLLTQRKELKQHQLKAVRFERNYTIFKNSLLAKEKAQLPQSPIILGNKESEILIAIISSPFCGHCKEVHEIMDAILAKHHYHVQIQVILKTNLETVNEESKKLFRSLMAIYKQDGETAFTRALKSWFDSKNIDEWFDLFPVNTSTQFDSTYNNQYKWCEENNYNFTPAIFINGYEYPQMYDRKNLQFYINDLVEDNF
ncbi:thioredoxin domain-containing protein [Flavobacterium sp. LB2R40]|uniref:thioredoxin domain-containing protein n=1 Tax=Flavobacterium sp. LB2R40 TaxID=3401722 RepID=UPI003AAA60FF